MNIFEKSGTRKNTKISFRTDDETLAQLKSICRIENRTISSLIENILTEYILIHENNSLAEQEKRLSPRKKCSISAVIMDNKEDEKTYHNCLIKSLSINSVQLVLKKFLMIIKSQNFFSYFLTFPRTSTPYSYHANLFDQNALKMNA